MKFNSTILISALALLFLSSNLVGQITINRSDYLMQTNQTDTALEMSSVNFPKPSSGLNQFWDYSSYTSFPFISFFDYDPSNNVNFPAANQNVLGDFVFQGGYFIFATDYFLLDSANYVELGKITQYAVYSIANRTGGANDSIYFPKDNRIYDVPDTLLKFPLNYLDSNITRPLDTINFQLTVASFGLNKTPGQVIYDKTVENKVIGSGQLVIPQPGSLTSDTLQVLLSRRIETRTDSIFLNGNPAPAPLIAAFGLNQGQTIVDTIYRFYRKGYRNMVTEIDYQNDDVLFFYNADKATGLNKFKVYKNLKGYPNPVNKGEVFQFELFENLQSGVITLKDIRGKIILSQSVNSISSEKFRIPETIKTGIYFIELVDVENNEKFINKIIVQ